MRWAASGDFPVHRLPGKKGGSVWAYAHELDAWLERNEAAAPDVAVKPADATDPTSRHGTPWLMGSIGAGAALLAVGAVVAVLVLSHRRPPHQTPHALPNDPAVAEIYLHARDDWSTRTPASLRKSIAEFGMVTSREPGFAPGYTGLADAYILSREFDAVPDATAFAKAQAAADLALTIDPQSADANRALGFIDYWGRGDIRSARAHFTLALKRDPNSAQTHFWYGNVLSTIGDDEGGLRELRAARLLDPGSNAIRTDYALALWLRGPGDPGVTDLQALAVQAPQLSSPHKFLSFIYLANGDIPAYLDQSARWAALQNSPVLTARVAAEQAAFKAGGVGAVLDLITRRPANARVEEATGTEWPATAASLLGRRALLLQIMDRARAAGDHWATWRQDQYRVSRWRGDATVAEGLKRLGVREAGAPDAASQVGEAGG